MIHLRIDKHTDPHRQEMACGIGAGLPENDMYISDASHHHMVNCPRCKLHCEERAGDVSSLSIEAEREIERRAK
jgi:hypothetical protein